MNKTIAGATLLSVVIPVFNEDKALPSSLSSIREVLRGLSFPNWEIVVVDDGSKDRTATILQAFQQTTPQLRVVCLTRNFGKEAAIYAGLSRAAGDAIIIMDGDLQHPPQLIPEMLRYWKAGAKVVEGIKRSQDDNSRTHFFSFSFNWLFKKISGLDLQHQSDYKLLDREVVSAYLNLNERKRFFRGLIAWLGYPSVRIPFEVAPRVAGKSAWNFWKLTRYAIGNLTAFTSRPLLWSGWLGLSVFAFGMIVGIISLVQKLSGHAQSGFTTVIILLVVLGGAQLISMGILGHYLAGIYEELKQRPHYISHENFKVQPESPNPETNPDQPG